MAEVFIQISDTPEGEVQIDMLHDGQFDHRSNAHQQAKFMLSVLDKINEQREIRGELCVSPENLDSTVNRAIDQIAARKGVIPDVLDVLDCDVAREHSPIVIAQPNGTLQ